VSWVSDIEPSDWALTSIWGVYANGGYSSSWSGSNPYCNNPTHDEVIYTDENGNDYYRQIEVTTRCGPIIKNIYYPSITYRMQNGGNIPNEAAGNGEPVLAQKKVYARCGVNSVWVDRLFTTDTCEACPPGQFGNGTVCQATAVPAPTIVVSSRSWRNRLITA
jgi:hypothetical protein